MKRPTPRRLGAEPIRQRKILIRWGLSDPSFGSYR